MPQAISKSRILDNKTIIVAVKWKFRKRPYNLEIRENNFASPMIYRSRNLSEKDLDNLIKFLQELKDATSNQQKQNP